MGFRVFTLLGVVSLLLATAASPTSDPSVGQADVESDTKYEAAGEEYAPLVYGGGDSGNPGWVTALFWNGSFVCTASLVDPQVVITAAHCVTTPGTYTVLIGEESLLASGITRTVTEIRSHPGFGANFNDTDLALLALNAPVTTVPLATLNTTGAWPGFAQPLAVMGWGEYFEGSGASLFLQGGAVYATSGMDGSYDPYYCDLDPWAMQQGEMFCYGGAVTVKACHGDSGGHPDGLVRRPAAASSWCMELSRTVRTIAAPPCMTVWRSLWARTLPGSNRRLIPSSLPTSHQS